MILTKQRITTIAIAFIMALSVFAVISVCQPANAGLKLPKDLTFSTQTMLGKGDINVTTVYGGWGSNGKVDKFEYYITVDGKKKHGYYKYKKNMYYSTKEPIKLYGNKKHTTKSAKATLKVRAIKGKQKSGWKIAGKQIKYH